MLAVAIAVLLAPAAAACAAGSGPSLELRLRYEQVDDEAFARDAEAQTLRARVGYRWRFAPALSLFDEFEHVEAFGNDHDSTANGRTGFPVVADPQGTELNQLYLAWEQPGFGAVLGRQRINLDNQRFIGAVGWRQNEQTFDAAWLRAGRGEPWTLRYGYLDKVHRVFGDDHPNPLLAERDLDAHLLNGSFRGWGGEWTGYAYLVEDQDVAAASSATWGLRYSGGRDAGAVRLGWTLEYARQHDYADSPHEIDQGYWLLEPSLLWNGIRLRAGWEQLGGDGRHAFQTPLATLHAFNGWADRFLTTPPGGLEDRYLGASGTVGTLGWAVAFHDFRADTGSGYGSEWDASLSLPLPHGLSALAKLARYDADGFSTDVTKAWLQLEWKY